MECELNCNRSILLERLTEVSDIGYLNMLKNRWFELRMQNIISIENFEKHINHNDKVINKEINKNFENWAHYSKWYFDENGYIQELDLIRNFVKIGINQLDEYFTSL